MSGLKERIEDVEYWKALLSDLEITKDRVWSREDLQQHQSFYKFQEAEVGAARTRITEDGYTQLGSNLICDKRLCTLVGEGIKTLVAHGWPASFIFLYDEAWIMTWRMAEFMRSVTGNEISHDMLAWHVNPDSEETGFSPHRDRQPEVASKTFREDGMAMYTTCWMPLVDATTDNSCLYMIPSKFDPGYIEGDIEEKDPLSRALPTKEAYQNIRGLPTEASGALIFTHRIIHWGSSGRPGSGNPRISLSIGFSDYQYEKPYLKDQRKVEEGAPLPDFTSRLALICAQMISYYQRFDFSGAKLAMFYEVLMMHKHLYDKDYLANTLKEHAGALKEALNKEKPLESENGDDDDDHDEEDIEDELLESVLNREFEGEIDFKDDFDELEEEEEVEEAAHKKQRV
jgi:hypothetical protein